MASWELELECVVTLMSLWPIVTMCDHCSNLKFRFVLPSVFLRYTMHTQPNAERDVLLKIQRTAVAILEGCNTGSHISKPNPFLDTSSILPSSHDIVAPIMKLPEGIRQELLGCFINRLNERERFLSVFKSTCSIAGNLNDLDAIRTLKQQQKNRSGKKTFNNVSACYCSYVCPSKYNFRNVHPYLKNISRTMHTHVPQIDWL